MEVRTTEWNQFHWSMQNNAIEGNATIAVIRSISSHFFFFSICRSSFYSFPPIHSIEKTIYQSTILKQQTTACTHWVASFSPTPRATRDSIWNSRPWSWSDPLRWWLEPPRGTMFWIIFWPHCTAWDCGVLPRNDALSRGVSASESPWLWPLSRNFLRFRGVFWMRVWWSDWRLDPLAFCIILWNPFWLANFPILMPASQQQRKQQTKNFGLLLACLSSRSMMHGDQQLHYY